MKICKRCGKQKSTTEFAKHSGCKGGLNNVCKECKRLESREFYKNNSKKILQGQKKRRRHQILRIYGINESTYSEILESQNGCCKICGKTQERRVLSVDHNHRTGKVRGLLCDRCNWMIGLALDSPEILMSAVRYLSE